MKKVFSLMLPLATLFTLTACGGSDDEPDGTKLSQSSYTMYHEDTQEIKGSNLSDILWNSENEFVATVKNNVITGQFVGETAVKSATKNLSFTVEVKPRYNTYQEPYLDWGASKSAIKAKCGTPKSEGTNSLLYETTNSNAPMVIYMFENGKMSSCGVVCKISTAYELGDFLVERYVPVEVDVDNYSAILLHCYGKISDPQVDYGVLMQYNSSIRGILVVYAQSDNSKSLSANNMDYENAFNSLKSAINKYGHNPAL